MYAASYLHTPVSLECMLGGGGRAADTAACRLSRTRQPTSNSHSSPPACTTTPHRHITPGGCEEDSVADGSRDEPTRRRGRGGWRGGCCWGAGGRAGECREVVACRNLRPRRRPECTTPQNPTTIHPHPPFPSLQAPMTTLWACVGCAPTAATSTWSWSCVQGG